MTRTKKKTKGPGYEYWSKRPGSRNHGQAPGKESKRINHRLERIEGKEEITGQLSEHQEAEITEAAIEDAAIRCLENFGAAKDLWDGEFGWILTNGELTDAGFKWCEKHFKKK